MTRPQLDSITSPPLVLVYDQDLYVLRRRDPSIDSIFIRLPGVSCSYLGEQWKGRLLVYEREIYPAYGFCILNGLGVIDHIQHLYPEDDISCHRNCLKLQSYPDFTSRRLSSAQSSSPGVIDKFSDVYAIPNLRSLESRKGTPKTVELSAPTEDISGVLMRLHSFIKDNKPFPKEFTTSGSLPRPISTSHLTPTSPCFTALDSPCPSPYFDSFSPLSSPQTSPAPSPGPTQTFSSLLLRCSDEDYRRKALLSHKPPLPTLYRPSIPLGHRTFTSEQAPSVTMKAATERPFSISGRLAQSRNLTAQATAIRSQRSSKSGMANMINSSVATASGEAVVPTSQLPLCRVLDGHVKQTSEYSFATGGFSELHRGIWERSDDEMDVAIKIIRIPGTNDKDTGVVKSINKHLDRELKVWITLNHPNVLPFFGICHDLGPFPALISPYCRHRDVVDYLKRNPTVNRWHMVAGFTEGMIHLHSLEVIHGDLKGTNVLVDENGEPRICDFGVSRIIDCPGFTTGFKGTPPFMAPELFPDGDEEDTDSEGDHAYFQPVVTKATDIYSYGFVALQILTGKDPIIRRFPTKPQRPKRRRYDPYLAMSDALWGLFESCFDFEPKKRPSMVEVKDRIGSMDDPPSLIVEPNH